jgi:predicted RNA-binding Zn ribbon-like protein
MTAPSRVLALVNSRLERPDETEEHLPDSAAADRWLGEHFVGFAGTLSDRDFAALRRLRAAARDLLLDQIAGNEPGQAALAVLNEAAGRVPRADRLTPLWSRETDYHAGRGAKHALATVMTVLANEAIELLSSDADLAECAADDCVILFIRTDPRRRWHNDRCGNRIRAARSYARRAHTAGRLT